MTCLIIVFPLIHRGERYNCALKIEKNVLLLRANIIYKVVDSSTLCNI